MKNFIKHLLNRFTYLRGFIGGAIMIVLLLFSYCYLFTFYKGGIKKSFFKDIME